MLANGRPRSIRQGIETRDGSLNSPAVLPPNTPASPGPPREPTMPTDDTRRATFLVQSDFDRLEDWCRMVRVILGGHGPFLVGSATERADYRDVDLRTILPDAVFDRLFRGRLEAVRFLNRALSVWGQEETGLPIDFQVQRMTEANEQFPGPRNAMGVRDWSLIPTSGVPRHAD